MCDHGDDKDCAFLEIFSGYDHEIYMCECGALIDLYDERNYDDPVYPMSLDELTKVIQKYYLVREEWVSTEKGLPSPGQRVAMVLQITHDAPYWIATGKLNEDGYWHQDQDPEWLMTNAEVVKAWYPLPVEKLPFIDKKEAQKC